MIQQSDIKGRLNLLRYGLVVLVVVTFITALLVPFISRRGIGTNSAGEVILPPITDFIGVAIIASVIVAILAVGVYFAYSMMLERMIGSSDTADADSADATA